MFDFTTENSIYQGGSNKYNYTKFYNSVSVIGQNCNNGTIYHAEISDGEFIISNFNK